MADEDKTPKDKAGTTDPDFNPDPKETVSGNETEKAFFEKGEALKDEEKPEDFSDLDKGEDEAPAKPENTSPKPEPEPTPAPEPKEDDMEDKKPETKPEPKPETTDDSMSTGGPSTPPPPAQTPATPSSGTSKFPWLAVLGALAAIALFVAFLTLNNKNKANSSSNSDDIAALAKTVGTVDGKVEKKADKAALKKGLSKKADKAALAGKLDKKDFTKFKDDLSKDRKAHAKFTDKNRKLICTFHKWRKECKDLLAKKKKDPKAKKSSAGSSGTKYRPMRRHRRSSSTSVATTNPALEKRVAALEKNDKRQDEVLEPLYAAQKKYGAKYKSRVRAALGLAPHVQAKKK